MTAAMATATVAAVTVAAVTTAAVQQSASPLNQVSSTSSSTCLYGFVLTSLYALECQ